MLNPHLYTTAPLSPAAMARAAGAESARSRLCAADEAAHHLVEAATADALTAPGNVLTPEERALAAAVGGTAARLREMVRVRFAAMVRGGAGGGEGR